MKIILVRHGEAESPTSSQSDAERSLTEKGVQDIHKLGRFLRGSTLVVKRVYYSPYLRTKMTAEILSDEIHFHGEMVPSTELAAGNNCSDIVSCLVNHSNSDTVLLVGHNPDITYFAAQLLGNQKVTENIVFQPGTCIAINVARERFANGQIIWAISPDHLANSLATF